MAVEFGELPVTTGRDPNAWQNEAAELKARPGQWARVATKQTTSSAGTLASRIKEGQIRAFIPAGHFQAVIRGMDVWARYVGPTDEE